MGRLEVFRKRVRRRNFDNEMNGDLMISKSNKAEYKSLNHYLGFTSLAWRKRKFLSMLRMGRKREITRKNYAEKIE